MGGERLDVFLGQENTNGDIREHSGGTSFISALFSSLHMDLVLDWEGQGEHMSHEEDPLHTCLVGKGCSFYITTDWAVASQIHLVIFTPSSLTINTSLNWEKRWLPSRKVVMTKVIVVSADQATFFSPSCHNPQGRYHHLPRFTDKKTKAQ